MRLFNTVKKQRNSFAGMFHTSQKRTYRVGNFSKDRFHSWTQGRRLSALIAKGRGRKAQTQNNFQATGGYKLY